MRAAYEALDDAHPGAHRSPLAAYHSLYHSQAKIGHAPKSDALSGFRNDGAPLRPLVKPHPETGRSALFIGRHAYGIPGLDPDESEALLDRLLSEACQAPRIYTHSWQVGDVVVWDNRAVLHRARPYDPRARRTMVHTRVAGERDSEYAAADPNFR